MSVKKKFTPEEIQELNNNPYTLCVTEARISLTLEGKKKLLELFNEGKSSRLALKEMGYNPEILGKHRITSILRKVREENTSEAGLHQGYIRRAKKEPLTAEELANLGTDERSTEQLKNEVAYLRAEVEFLKKISQKIIAEKQSK